MDFSPAPSGAVLLVEAFAMTKCSNRLACCWEPSSRFRMTCWISSGRRTGNRGRRPGRGKAQLFGDPCIAKRRPRRSESPAGNSHNQADFTRRHSGGHPDPGALRVHRSWFCRNRAIGNPSFGADSRNSGAGVAALSSRTDRTISATIAEARASRVESIVSRVQGRTT